LDKNTIENMIKNINYDCIIEKIEKQWLRYEINNTINNDNINEGIFEWYVKLRHKVDVRDLNYLTGGFNKYDIYVNLTPQIHSFMQCK